MKDLLTKLNILDRNLGAFGKDSYPDSKAEVLDSYSPIDNSKIASVELTSEDSYEKVISDLEETYIEWRKVPAPKRGEIIRKIANAMRDSRDSLGKLISTEVGKIYSEGIGEVQEAIDIADFAAGLSRQLYGQTMHSERPEHRMYEQWHPLGIVGVITAFNFPMAVWAWNSMLAAVCGDVVLWKPSEQTPLSAIAINSICREIAKDEGFPALFSLVFDNDASIGKKMAADRRIPLISATGSCGMGRAVGQVVAGRLGKCLLELGGNNAVIVDKEANIEMAVRSTLFGAVGTAGQRCTSTRRIIIDKEVSAEFIKKLSKGYENIKIGDPLQDGILMGPLINTQAVKAYEKAIKEIKDEGGEIIYGGGLMENMPSELYVKPTIVKANINMKIVKEETFAPILYILEVSNMDEAIKVNNSVSQGLSSAVFTNNLQNAEKFLSYSGSDCGIANVNLGTSGAEIGGAFGGEKDTGGGRESGSDSWKQYMRRQTNTINYSSELPLAQGVKFE